MFAFRWIALTLFVVACGLGCQGEPRPDTDPSDSELQVPNVDSGDSANKKSDASK